MLKSAVFFTLWTGSASLVTLFLYLVWTPPGSAAVEGLQGRYFLPYQMVLGAFLASRLGTCGNPSKLSENLLRIGTGLQLILAGSMIIDALRGYRI
jgi:uncharacterized membrane protein